MTDPRLISDARALLDSGQIPVKDRLTVSAAIRQAEELPALAKAFNAEDVLLRAVGFCPEGL